MPRFNLAPFAAFAVFSVIAAPAAALECASASRIDRIVGIPARGEVRLASGATVRLAGVRLADAGETGADARALLDGLLDARVAVRIHAQRPDRWGRVPGTIALVAADGAEEDGADLARRLVAGGLALVDAGELGGLCDPGLLDVETAARRAGLGLWSDPAAAPLSASDDAAVAARIDRFALVEGRVRRVGVRERRVYLDFAAPGTDGFTAIVPADVFADLEAGGLDARALRGRRIRVRGIIQSWRGTAVTITASDMIEILETRPGAR